MVEIKCDKNGHHVKKMRSVRCFGETKFFRQCPRYLISDTEPCFCYDHKVQTKVRIEELEIQRRDQFEGEWAPLGAYTSNIKQVVSSLPSRLTQLAHDDQNVHTPEVQLGVSGAIKRLLAWGKGLKTDKNLTITIQETLLSEPDDTEQKALDHLVHCYQWNDDTRMFGTTYPLLATIVWARVDRDSDNRILLRDRFFEEVADSAGQCLNGNMARLVNVFAGIDLEMSPYETTISREQLQNLASRVVNHAESKEQAIQQVEELLEQADVSETEKQEWLECVRDAFS